MIWAAAMHAEADKRLVADMYSEGKLTLACAVAHFEVIASRAACLPVKEGDDRDA